MNNRTRIYLLGGLVFIGLCMAWSVTAQDYTTEDLPVELQVPQTVWCGNCDHPEVGQGFEEARFRNSFINQCIRGWQRANETAANRPQCFGIIGLSLASTTDTPIRVCMKSVHVAMEAYGADNMDDGPCDREMWFEPTYDAYLGLRIPLPPPFTGYNILRLRTFTVRTIDQNGTPHSWTYPANVPHLPVGPDTLHFPSGHFMNPYCSSQSQCNTVGSCFNVP